MRRGPLLLRLALIFICRIAVAQPASVPDLAFPVVNGPVYSAVQTNGILYVGGGFDQVGPLVGGIAALSPATGKAIPPFPYVWGAVSCIITETNGRAYFGGTFNGTQRVATTNLARLTASGLLDSNFTFAINGNVAALAISGSNLFIGGSFSAINGISQSNLAVVDLSSNGLAAWSVSIDGPVTALAVSDNLLYLGGVFAHVGGLGRASAACIDLNTGTVTPWNPSPDSMFGFGLTILISYHGRLYAAGDFTTIAGAPRNQIAAFDATTGVLLPWDARVTVPYTVQTVDSVAISSNAVYIGGNFTGLGGQPRSSIGAVDPNTGDALPWNPGIPWNTVQALAVSGNTVYVGGDFPWIGSNGPPRLAAVDATTGVPQAWAPNPGGTVLTIVPGNGLVLVGGSFNSLGGASGELLAAVDLSSKQATTWNPRVGANAESGDYIWQLAAGGDSLFLAGRFFALGGQLVNPPIGAVRMSDGSLLPFHPTVTGTGFSLAGTNLIITSAGPAILDTVQGQSVGWNFNADGNTYSVTVAGNLLYIAGDFTHVSGQPRSRLAAFDFNTRQLLPWSPIVDDAVSRIISRDQTIIAFGNFHNANGQPRSQIAVFDAVSGDLALGPVGLSLDGALSSAAASGGALYLAGLFTQVNGTPRTSFAAIDLLTGSVRSWDPEAPSTGGLAIPMADKVIIGGGFSSVGDKGIAYLAAFPITNPPPIVQITSPTNLTIVNAPAQLPLNIQAASPSNTISRVEVYARTNLLLSSAGGTLATNWVVPTHIGDYLLTAVAYDQYGESAFSSQVRVRVLLPSGYVAPTLAITFPSNNATYTYSNINVQTAISSPSGAIEFVRFFLGTNLISTLTNAPFGIALSNLALGTYSVTAQLEDEFGIDVTNGPVTFTVTKPPATITNVPVALTLPAGTNWIFHVKGVGDPPIAYQWQFQGVKIVGATNVSLVLTNVQAAGAGQYSMVVSNAYGATTNLVCTLTVADSRPVIYAQPLSQLFQQGANITLCALAYGTAPLSYQWWYDSQLIPGATSAQLQLTNLRTNNAGAYYVVVTNAFGAATSDTATLSSGDPYPGQVDWPSLSFALVVTNTLTGPVSLAHAGDGSGRLFVVQQSGQIQVIQGNSVLAQPFLVITNEVLTSSECGLLGLAFAPGFGTNGHFYVNYTRQPDSATVISRFLVTKNGSMADTNSENVVLVIPQPFATDKGGQLAFGPDGYLYIGMGDGGESYTGGDPYTNGQNSASLLGKLLRIDVESGVWPYAIPTNNPFVGNTNYAPEIWALGFRNPWHFSFDRQTGDLYIGDVGEWRYDEIDFQPANSAGGQNYGWRIMEGPAPYIVPPGFTNFSEFTAPVFYYSHFYSQGGVVGGYNYRGPNEPRMNATYFMGDRWTGVIRALKQAGTNWQNVQASNTPFAISTFGEDDSGNLFLADYNSGHIYAVNDTHQVLIPAFLPAGGIIYSNSVTVTCATPGVVIHYTTDGRSPTEFDPAVPAGGTIPVISGARIQMQAFRPDLTPSQVASATFTFAVAPLVFAPPSGPITNGASIALSTPTPGATIRYTLDGSSPTTNSALYTGPFAIAGGTTVTAQGYEDGYLSSPVAAVFYSLVQTATPVFTLPSGPVPYGTSIAISCATPGATIYFTADGSAPTTNSPVYVSPLAVFSDVTISAFAVTDGHLDSSVNTVSYGLVKAANPILSPTQGPLTNGALISMNCATTGATIRYTLDGSDPGTNSAVYSTPLTFSSPVTIKARAYGAELDPSDVVTVFFGLIDLESSIVTTFAGSTTAGFSNAVGTAARFFNPQAVCIDASGNCYVADTGNNVIRKILPSGLVTTFAGTGVAGSQLGWATNAQFSAPTGVAVDHAGNVYVADGNNCNRVCKIDPTGNVTVLTYVRGDCYYAAGLWQLAVDAAQNVYVGSWATVQKITPTGSVIGLGGTGCACPGGWGINVAPTVDSSTNVYVATEGGIWRIMPDGTTDWYAGDITGFSDGPRLLSLFQAPQALAVDSNTNLLVADVFRVRKIRADGWVSTLAGSGIPGYLNGLGSLARFSKAVSVCSDGHEGIYVADSANNCIRKITLGSVPRPLLQVDSVANQIVLTWPIWASGFALEASPTLYPTAAWTLQTNGIVALDNHFVLTNIRYAGTSFYRLRQQ